LLDGGIRWGKQEVASMICYDPVNFFGHSSIVAPQAGFDVRSRNMKFSSRKHSGHSRIRVAIDKHAIETPF
jgi:hypothetical protein